MKRNRLVKLLYTTIICAGALFTSCHDNIYELIEKEVLVDESGLDGDLSKIVRCNGYLFTANGIIYRKRDVPSSEVPLKMNPWIFTNLPSYHKSEYGVSDRVDWLASDDTYLYAMVNSYEEGENGENENYRRYIFATEVNADGSFLEWKLVTTGYFSPLYLHQIFDNQATTGRNAYINILGKIYKLNGTAAPEEVADDDLKLIGGSVKQYVINCVKFKGTDYFSMYYTMAANEDLICYSRAMTTGSTYSASGDNVIFYSEDGENFTAYYTGSTLLSLALTKDYFFYGTTAGLERSGISEEKKPTMPIAFTNNGGSIISEHVYVVFVLDQDKKMEETDLYAASTIYGSIGSSTDTYDSIGMYACPSGNLSNWNRD